MGTTSTLDRCLDSISTNGILGERVKMTWLPVHLINSILIPPIVERESVDGMANECEARRAEYWRSQTCKTMSVGGEVGMAARRAREEWIGRRESSWEVVVPPGRGAVNVRDRRVSGVGVLAASQPEGPFCNR